MVLLRVCHASEVQEGAQLVKEIDNGKALVVMRRGGLLQCVETDANFANAPLSVLEQLPGNRYHQIFHDSDQLLWVNAPEAPQPSKAKGSAPVVGAGYGLGLDFTGAALEQASISSEPPVSYNAPPPLVPFAGFNQAPVVPVPGHSPVKESRKLKQASIQSFFPSASVFNSMEC